MGLNHEVAKDLLSIKAVQIHPEPENYFTWTSGIKSPIYCDNRLTMSYPKVRERITQAFIQKIKEWGVQPDVIAGCATAGIPHAAWLSKELDLPMIYIRSEAKKHGKGNQIEGEVQKGKKVVVIEDLISTGGSSIDAAMAAKESGFEVIGVLAIFTYGLEKANQNFADAKLDFDTITTFDHLLEILEAENKFEQKDVQSLLTWRDSM